MHVREASFGIIPMQQNESIWQVLLILHREGGHWSFPKGRGNPGETALESASRELYEETGLEIERIFQAEILVETYTFWRKGDFVLKTVQYFPALVKGTTRLQPEEIQDAKWVPMHTAAKYLTFKETKKMYLGVLERLHLEPDTE